jgi:hypothetical protein
MVGNPEYVRQTGESRLAGACLHYGFNEDTDSHCPEYWDRDNPNPDPLASQRPIPPSIEVRSWRREHRQAHLDPQAAPLLSLAEWQQAVLELRADGDAIQVDSDHVLRLSLGVSDHGAYALDAPYFHDITLHLDRCLPGATDAHYDTWWMVASSSDTSLPFPDDESPLPPASLATVLPALAAHLFPPPLITSPPAAPTEPSLA